MTRQRASTVRVCSPSASSSSWSSAPRRSGLAIVSRATSSAGSSRISFAEGTYSRTTSVSPSDTDWPSSQTISLTTPSSSASTGISIFMDSRITSVSPSVTAWPTWHSTFQTVPVMGASTSAKPVLLWVAGAGKIPTDVILAIDQGTTGTTCLVFDERGQIGGRAYPEFTQHFPRPGWVEHDAGEIWEVTRAVAREALDAAGIDGRKLTGIGITNQRETVVAWDRDTGEPLHRAIVWQDRRTAARCDELRAAGHEPLVRERTGLVLDPYFSGTKLEWLLREGDGPRDAAFGTIDSWLVFKLTGRHVTDYSNASRTLLFDIGRLRWDPDLCELLGAPPDGLPEPRPSAEVYGETTEFGGSVLVAGIAGDQQAALYGQACHQAGLGKNTYGTGSFVLQNAGGELPEPAGGLLTTVAWGVDGRVDYALEAAIFVTGAAVQWLRDGLGIIQAPAATEELARSLDSNDGVYMVPAFTGLGSPHWDPYARGTIVGLTRGAGRA